MAAVQANVPTDNVNGNNPTIKQNSNWRDSGIGIADEKKGNVKKYAVKTTNFKRTIASIKPVDNSGPAYEAELSFILSNLRNSEDKKPSVLLKSTTDSAVIGVGMVDLLSLNNPIRICVGDPNLPTAQWLKVPARERWMGNIYEMVIGSSSQPSRTYNWKRTHEGEDIGSVAKKLDFLNLKLEDGETGQVVARFVHNPWAGSERGHFEIFGDEVGDGDKWMDLVLLSGMTVLEYQRKMQGWSW